MNPAVAFPNLAPALPEIVLALGALVLLVIGAYRGDRATSVASGAAVSGSASQSMAAKTKPNEGSTISTIAQTTPKMSQR